MSTNATNIPALAAGRTAVITGAASGIGLAAGKRLAVAGMNVVLADRGGSALDAAAFAVAETAGSQSKVLAVACDVAEAENLVALADRAFGKFGEVSFLMNNAGVGNNPGKPWENLDAWKSSDRRQFLGRRPRRAGLHRAYAGSGHTGDDRQHRFQAGHHHAARQPRLQCLQGRAEDLHRRVGPRAAQRAGRENLRASAYSGLHLHRHEWRHHDEGARRVDRRAGG